MKALTRTLHALPLMLCLWLASLLFGQLASVPTRAAVNAAMRGGGWLDDGHLLGAVLEVITQDPAVMSILITAVVSSVILGFLFWIPFAGPLFERLAGHTQGPGPVLSGVRWSASVAVQSVYSWVLRVIVLGVLMAISSKLAWVGILLPLAYVSLILGFDYLRARVILQDEKPWSPLSPLRALRDGLKAPGLFLGGACLIVAQLAAAALVMWLAASASDDPRLMLWVRLAAFLPLFFSCWRISAVIGRVERDHG